MMIPADKIQSVRLLCLMLTAASLYALLWPHRQSARVGFVTMPLTTRQARTVGTFGLVVAVGLWASTIW